MAQLLDLPGELLLRVVQQLPVKTQANVAQTCRALRALLADGSLLRLQVARFDQRIALRRPVEPELLPFVRSIMLPAVDVGATVLRQLARACGVQVETVVFNVPAQSVWTPVFDALRDIPTVRALRFSGCDLADWDCRGLAAVAQLESLVFENCPDMPAGLLPVAATLQRLRQLKICDAHLFASTDANTLGQLTRLEELRLWGYAALSDSGMGQIGQLASLKSLELDSCQGLADQSLRRLGPLPALQRLSLARCHFVTDASLQHITSIAPQLQRVDVSHCFRVSDVGFALLAHLPHLIELSAQECARLSPRGLIALARMAPRLQLLDLRLCTEVTDENITDMLTVMGAVVQLSANADEGDARRRIASPPTPTPAVPMPAAALQPAHPLAEALAAGAAAVPPLEAPAPVPEAALGGAPGPRLELQTLRLGYSHAVSDRSLRVVAEALPRLVELDVANCRLLTDAGLENLVQLTQLQRLNLSRCVQVTDAGIALLVQCPKLADLNVAYCDQLTDAALVHISNLRELQVLDIAGCWRLTFRGLVPLARFANLRILRGSSSP